MRPGVFVFAQDQILQPITDSVVFGEKMVKSAIYILCVVGVLSTLVGCLEGESQAHVEITTPEETVRKFELVHDAWRVEIVADDEVIYQHVVSAHVALKNVHWFGLEPCEPHLGRYRNWCEQYVDDSEDWSSLDRLFAFPVIGHHKAPYQSRYSTPSEELPPGSTSIPLAWHQKDLLQFAGQGSSLRMTVPLYDMLCEGSPWNEASVEVMSLKTQFYPEEASSIVVDGVFLCATTSVDVQVRFTRLEDDGHRSRRQ